MAIYIKNVAWLGDGKKDLLLGGFMPRLEEVHVRRVPFDKKSCGLAIMLAFLIVVSAFPFVAQIVKAPAGQWTDTFADETKVLSKSNTEVVAGNARIQTLATDYNWQKQGVVVDIGGGGEPDESAVYYPWVLKGADGVYRMWYPSTSGGGVRQVMYATSWDGYTWEKHGVVIPVGFSGTGSDSRSITSACVIEEGNQYRMYYTGADGSDMRITLMAASPDGLVWTYDGLAINVGGAGETLSSSYAAVLDDGVEHKAWYSGYSSSYQIFLATSPDRTTWTKQGLVMPLGAPGQPDDNEILKNVVVQNSTGTYRMWYGAVGAKWRILYAESPDGYDWSNRKGIVMYEGSPGEPDDLQIGPGSVRLPVNNAGWMWYAGWDTAPNVRAMIATMGSLGNLTSTTITKSPGYDWEKLFLNKTVIPDETEVLVSVVNANTLRPYPGYSDLSGTVIDLSSIPKGDDNIRLRADFYGTTTNTPLLEDWSVTWDDIAGPLFGGLISATDDGTGGAVTLNWNPGVDPSTPISYNIYIAVNSMGQNFGIPNYTTMANSYPVTGLKDGVRYYFIVRAEDSMGFEEKNTIERTAIPTTPIDLTPPTFGGLQSAVDTTTGGSVTLTWTSATDPDTPESNTDPSLPISYNVYYSDSPGGQDFLTPNATTALTNLDIIGLTNGQTYYFVVRAEDSVGNEEGNLVERSAIPTTPVDSTPPNFNGLDTAVDLGSGGAVSLTWTAANDPDTAECNSDPSLPVTYNIYHSVVSGAQDFMTPNATTASTFFDFTGLQNGAFSYFVVRAEDSAGNEDTNLIEKSALPTTPVDDTAPNFGGLQFAIDAGTGGTVTLNWQTATDPDTVHSNSDPSLPINYDVFYSTTSGGQDFISPNATTTALTIDVTGLTDGVLYYFVVRARDSAGNQESNIVERSAIPTTPLDDMPPFFAGLDTAVDSQTDGNITLAWIAATDPDTIESNTDPSNPITYSAYISTISGNQNFLLPNATTQSTIIEISGLMNGVTYYFVVRASDAVGNQESNVIERSAMPTTPVDDEPPVFSGVVVASDAGTGGAIDVFWAAAADPDLIECNSDPSNPITYSIYYSTTSGGQNFFTPDATTQGTSIQILGLQDGVTYYFVVRAEDAVGNKEFNTVEASAMPTTPVDTTPPQFLGLISATDLGTSGDVSLTWASATDPDTVECNSDPSLPLQYNIYISLVSSGQDFLTPNQTATGNQALISGLADGVTYYFVVRAEDAAGNEEDNTIEHSGMPTTPTDNTPPDFGGLNLVVIDNDGGDITLTWNAATDPDDPECNTDPSTPITFNIYVSESPTAFDFSQPSATTSQQQYPFLDLERGVTYYFVVRAEDNAGNEETNTVTKSGELGPQEEEEFNFLDYWWIFLIIIIILLLVVIALMARKKRPEEPEEAPEEEEEIEQVEEEGIEEPQEAE
jgi:predicted GH43/DUF377 family glycosyl hydrolase